ncbi:ESPR-type extended signal peptide-containing protein [Variovorax sp. IB41]|uniref:ESPR-type extended signal peptide-containing protein n=1 Tax=Variovorax sp. IB41 TaxID=2779370 RepID=UPI0018E74096|nr:ESPR-type extended signal peptide-containing protein [Variovorax sp. IB41]MBJ2160222.1 YadA-like family protein [Variovorax sp. IB41]
MNRIFRSVWSESLGAWVATAETSRARGRRGSVRASVVAAATLLGGANVANVAWGAQAVNDGTLCMSQSGPGQTWTCHVPNSKGGFAIIKGLPDVGNGSSPDWVAVANAAAASVGTNALLLGDTATVATGNASIAVGNGGKATAASAIAIGTFANAAGGSSIAIGLRANAAGGSGVAIGNNSLAAATGSVAVGVQAHSSYEGNIVIGRQASDGGGDQTIVIGDGAGINSKGMGNLAIGYQAGQNTGTSYSGGPTVQSDSNAAFGNNAGQYVNGGNNLAVGGSAGGGVEGYGNAAFGSTAGRDVVGSTNLAMGQRSGEAVRGDENIAIGRESGALITGTRNVAMGAGAGSGVLGSTNIGIGYAGGNSVRGDYNSAVGYNAGLSIEGSNNASFGTGAGFYSKTDLSVALGVSAGAYVQGYSNVALGRNAGSGSSSTPLDADYAISIGDSSRAAADRAIAIGSDAKALGVSSISIGTGNTVNGARSGAIGDPSFINADDSYAIGNNNTIAAGANQSFVLGNNVSVTNANNVVLGNNSADKAAVQVTSATVPTVIATLNPDGTVSYSAGPAVTYGNFAGTATGVVSVGAAGAERQIVNVAPGAITATSTDAINGSQLYNAVTTLSGSITTIVNNAQTHYYSVNDGGTKQGNYANDGASGANSVAAGAGASASGAGAVAVGNAATASAANSVAVGSNATASTANSVALGNGSTTTAATPTASTTIQGQTYNFAGANPVGVVSVGAPGAERQIQNVAAGQLSATSTDAVNGSQLYATNQAVNNIQGGGGIKYFHANSQAADSQAAGAESVAIGPQAVSQGAGSIAIGNSTIATATNGVALGANATADRAGMSGQKELFSNAVVNSAQGAVSVGSTGNERQITNVAGGTQATDAVNVRQLQAVKNSSVQYDTNGDGTVNHNSITLGNNTGPTTIRNVAPGVAPTDAVNVQQLQGSVANSAAYTDARVNQMGQSIDQIGKKAYAGVAAAMAMESAPYVPGKVTYAAGMGYYEQQSAVGVSLRKTADNGRWSVTGGASATTRGSVGFRVGIGGVWD